MRLRNRRIAALHTSAGIAVSPLYQCVAGIRNTSHSNVFGRSPGVETACKTGARKLSGARPIEGERPPVPAAEHLQLAETAAINA
jgi:hypothetical protein